MKITSVSIDLRNFTTMFHGLLELPSNERHVYLSYIQEYIQLCINYAKKVGIEDELDFVTTGDGIIVIFKDSEHSIRAYMYILIINKVLTKFLNKIKLDNISPRLVNIDFGIGVDSGKAEILYFTDNLKNHLSDAINISSRLEGLSKTFVGKRIIISSTFFWSIIDLLYSKEFEEKFNKSCYSEVVAYSKELENNKNVSDAKAVWDLMTFINETLFFRYLSGISLKGLESPKIAYCFSKTLFKMNINNFLTFHEKTLKGIFKEEYLSICNILKE